MKTAVSNSGPLIHLTTVGLLDLLFKLFDKIYIPPLVYEEVVVRGKRKGHSDATLIENAISNEKIVVKKLKEAQKQSERYYSPRLHPGEMDAIKLITFLDINIILSDDEEARIFARTLQLKVKGSLGVLIELSEKGYLNSEKALQKLQELNSMMYLSSDVYNYVREQIEKP